MQGGNGPLLSSKKKGKGKKADLQSEEYQQTIEQLSAPIAWVVLPGGIRCPVIPASL